jgi:hypothetical protein
VIVVPVGRSSTRHATRGLQVQVQIIGGDIGACAYSVIAVPWLNAKFKDNLQWRLEVGVLRYPSRESLPRPGGSGQRLADAAFVSV